MKKIYSLIISCVMLICAGSAWGDELTVANGTATNSNVPVWGNWCDNDLHNQLIYPASLLTSMQNKNITSMTFYLSSSAAAAWTSTFTIGLAEVEESAIANNGGYWATYYHNSAATTVVYSGSLDGTGTTIVITFSSPFYYEGGNLLFDLTSIAGNYKDASFYGENQSSTAYVASHGSTTATSSSTGGVFLPKTTFTYVAAAPITCPKPTDLGYSNVTATSVDLDWTNGGTESSWNVLYKASSDADWSSVVVNSHPHTLSSLTPNSNYQVKVQAVCGVGDESSFSNVVSFPTPCASLSLPWTLDLSSATDNTILECWDNSGSASTTASGSTSYYVWGVYTSGSDKMLRMCNYFVKSGTALINTPNIVVPNDGKEYQLVFNYSHTASCGAFKVLISEDGGSSFSDFSPVASYTKVGSTTSYTAPEAIDDNEAVVSLAGYNNKTIMLQFNATANYDNGAIFLKNIRIIAASSCEKPTLNNATDETFEGATFSWEGDAAQYQYAVVASGAAVSTWSEPISAKTYTITGKNAATTYDFYVRSYCSSSEQSEGAKKSFTTATVTAPTNVTISGETTDGANASWDAVAGISHYQYVVMDAGVAADWTSPTTVNTNAATLSGLQPGQSYDLYVRSYYAGNGATAAAEKVNFRTACTAIASAASWTDSFDDYATGSSSSKAPGCWKLLNANGEGHTPHIYVKDNSGYYYSGWAKDGTQYLFFSAYSDAGYGFAIFPEFETAVSSLQIKFSYIIESGSTLDFGYLTDISDASTFNSLKSCTSTSLTDDEVALSTVPTGARLAFRHKGGSTYSRNDASVDAISFEALSTCDKPQNLSAATSITPEGATFSWTAGGTETQYQWAVAEGTADPVWIDDAAHKVSTTSKTLTGLTLGTSYKFYVRSYCAGDSQSEALESETFAPALGTPANIAISGLTATTVTLTWDAVDNATGYTWLRVAEGETKDWNNAQSTNTNSVSMNTLTAQTNYTFYVRAHYEPTGVDGAEASTAFATPCLATTLPFAENFDEGMPSCWNNANGTTTTDAYKWSSFNENYDGNTGKCVRFDSYNNNSGRTNTLETQPINLSVNAELKFWWKNPTGGTYSVQISTNGGTTKTTLKDNMTGETTWVEEEGIDLSAYTGNIVTLYFNGTSNGWNNQAYLYLDEVRIEALPTCFKPATLNEATAITVDGATFSWTASGKGETDYQYAVALAGEAPIWNVANVVEGATTVTIDGLQAQTNYDFYVRSYCGSADQSEWRKVSFRTGCGVYSLPFDEDFNSVGTYAIPECWSNAGGTSSDDYKWNSTWTTQGRNYSQGMRFNSSTNDDGATNVLATPTIQLGEGNLLSFWTKNPTGGDFKVQIKVEGEAAADLLTDITGLTEWTFKYVSIPASYNNKKVQILFQATSNGGDANAYIYIDDVRVARGEVFEDVENNETRLSGLSGVLDVVIGRTIFCDGDYNTICLPFSLSEEQLAASPLAGATFKAFTSAVIAPEELQVNVVEVKSGLDAGVPYLLKMSAANNLVSPLFKNVTISAKVGNTIGKDQAVEFIGTFNPVAFTAGNQNTLFVYTNNTLTWSDTNSSLKAFRAYFNRTPSAGAPLRHGMKARIVEQEETATGIDNTQAATVQSVKILENDHVVIIRNGVKYNIQGQVIEK